jgi:ubiquinone biosynthesis monooxygenase Coq7
MEERQLGPLDRLLSGIGSALRATASTSTQASRPNPAAKVPEATLSTAEKTHAAGLMRVNHAGEIAAQGLYQGHAAVARDPKIEQQMQAAADEELDHLGWCEERLGELGSQPSMLRPIWYAGAWVMGATSGVLGDKWSLGFIEETERQVSEHLTGHLGRLPESDAKSRAIVTQMRDEEELHGANARDAGAAELPAPIRKLMRLTAKAMTGTAYWI